MDGHRVVFYDKLRVRESEITGMRQCFVQVTESPIKSGRVPVMRPLNRNDLQIP
jgi:hypothetical protein